MLADIPKRQIAQIHPVDNERAGDPQNVGCVVRAEFSVFREHGDSLALKEAADGGPKQGHGPWRKPHDLILARSAPNPDLDLIAPADLAKGLGYLAVLV